MTGTAAIRAVVRGEVQGVGFRDATSAGRASSACWAGCATARTEPCRFTPRAPGARIEELVRFLREGPPLARVAEVAVERVAVEGHEQFAIRGVSAGRLRRPGARGAPPTISTCAWRSTG